MKAEPYKLMEPQLAMNLVVTRQETGIGKAALGKCMCGALCLEEVTVLSIVRQSVVCNSNSRFIYCVC